MSLYDYHVGMKIARKDYPFYSLIMVAMLQADTDNVERLKAAFPDIHRELAARYHARAGVIPEDNMTAESFEQFIAQMNSPEGIITSHD